MRVARFVGMLVGVVMLVGVATGATPLRGAVVDTQVVATVSSFSPATGAVGTSVVITGTGFTDVSGVQFNGVSASDFSTDSDTRVTATVPTGATSGPIIV